MERVAIKPANPMIYLEMINALCDDLREGYLLRAALVNLIKWTHENCDMERKLSQGPPAAGS